MFAPRSTALLLIAAALGFSATSARATDISRCAGADGAAVYTDGTCASLGARETAMPTTLLRTLAKEAGDTVSGASRPAVALGQLRAIAGDAGGNRPRSYAGCPRTPEQLQSAFQESVATGDVNNLAAIYDWTNVSDRQSRDILRRLERISRMGAQDVSDAASGFHRRSGCLLLSL